MGCRVELTDVEHIALVLEDGGLVVINIKVVGSREQCHDRRESSRPGLAVHTIAKDANQTRRAGLRKLHTLHPAPRAHE